MRLLSVLIRPALWNLFADKLWSKLISERTVSIFGEDSFCDNLSPIRTLLHGRTSRPKKRAGTAVDQVRRREHSSTTYSGMLSNLCGLSCITYSFSM